MAIDFSTADHVRQYRDEQGAFRALPPFAKAFAAYIRTLVDLEHGWLHLDGKTLTVAILTHTAGEVTRAQRAMLTWCLQGLVEEGYLNRCEIKNTEPATMTTRDGRQIPLSPWAENPDGDWLVVKNWVPAQHGLSREDTATWHEARRENNADGQSAVLPATIPSLSDNQDSHETDSAND